MSSQTELSAEAVESLTAAYDIGEWQSCARTPKGHDNVSFFLSTSSDRYVLRRSGRRKVADSLRFEIELLDYLKEKGYPGPELVSTRTGQRSHQHEETFYVITRLIPGGPIDRENPHHLREAGRSLALFHRTIRSFSAPRYERSSLDTASLWTNGFPRKAEMEQMGEKALDGDERKIMAQSVSSLEGQFDRVRRELIAVLPGLDKLITQGSFGESALIFDGDLLVGVVDFDRAAFDFINRDLAYTVRSLCEVKDETSEEHKVGFDFHRYRELMAGYQEVEPLPNAEIEAIPTVSMGQRLLKVMNKWNSFFAKYSMDSIAPRKLQRLVKILALEASRVAWLERHSKDFVLTS